MAADLCYPVLRRESFVIPEAKFKTKTRPTHGGLDFTPVVQGAPVALYAIESGVVVISDHFAEKGDMSGKEVMILTKSGRRWWYGHLSEVHVKLGVSVQKGQVIGRMGTTGNSSGVHLHLELHYPIMNAEIDPWPWLWDAPDAKGETLPPAPSREKARADYPKYDSGANKPSTPLTPTPPAPPVKTPEQIEEEELMAARDDIIAAFQAEARMIESRIRREVRPEPYFINEGADGTRYTVDNSPAAALIQPSTGFILPLDASDNGKRGQLDSLKSFYRITAFDTQSNGFPESVFYNTIKDVARGAGIIDRAIGHDEGVAWAKALFAVKK